MIDLQKEIQRIAQVSVIVPHYNDLAGLDICLSALVNQTFPADQTEIIVADNASPQGWEAVEKTVANRARLIAVQQRGAGPARNGAVAVSNGEILAFVDSDCRPDPEWIEQGMAALAKTDIVGGRVDVLVQNPDQISAAEAFERVFAFNIEDYLTRKGFVGSGNLFCNRKVFDRVGGFGTGLSEDVDWSHRAAAMHFTIGYAPRAIVGHPARRSWAELRNKWFRINAETYSLKMRRRNGRTFWLLACMALPLSAFAHTPRVMMSKRIKGQQKLAALGVLYRIRFWRMWDYWRLFLDLPRI
jgi:glycosyltransferase involved in cell wall biosynthesis